MTKKKFEAKVILTIGISNCGKSTWSKEFIKKNPMFTEINRDDLRIAFFCDGKRSLYNDYKFSKEKEGMVTEVAKTRAEFAIGNGQGIIISDTNLNAKTRNFWKKFAKEKGVPYEEQIFDVPLQVCTGRNVKRDITLPKRVLLQQHASFRKFMGLPSYVADVEKPRALIVDLDGTWAHNTHRMIFDYAKVGTDTVDPVVDGILYQYVRGGGKVIVFTGREDKKTCRADTLEWLAAREASGIPIEHFDMRAEGDKRADVLAKEEMFWKIAEDYNVEFALDDRTQVVDLWRGLGLKCLQVADGNF